MQNNQPLVSIITPSYNQGKYIEETLRSVIRQDYPSIEYIVIDGGSTDNSVAVINRYEDQLAYFVSEKDKGQSDAINKGFSKATGEIIAWLNSDDVYTQHAVTRAVDALADCPECGFVFGNVLSIDMKSRVFNTMTFGDWGLEELARFKIISQPGIFMRKSALDAVGFLNADYDYLMDHHLWLKIAAMYPIQYFDQFWAAARYHPAAKNLTGGAHYGDEAFMLIEWMKNDPDLQNIIESDEKKVTAGANHLRARYLLDSGENWKSLLSYIKAAVGDPNILRTEYKRIAFALINGVIPIECMKRSFLTQRTNMIKTKNYDRLLAYINE